jgi:hypothetical protein
VEAAPETDEENNPQVETQPKSTEDNLLKKAIEVVTKGKKDAAQMPAPDKGPRTPDTPLHVPPPQQP